MHRCFATVIEPLLAGLGSRTFAEVGAGHGRVTARILRAATRGDITIHAIEPYPTPELLRLAREDPRVEVHAARGADALGAIGAVDLVLLDGDPNWSTTHAELAVVAARSREAGRPTPVIVVHNVHWPFGRRDGYHAAHVPEAALRREYRRRIGRLLRVRRDPGALWIYVVKCAMHYHAYTMARRMDSGRTLVYNTFL